MEVSVKSMMAIMFGVVLSVLALPGLASADTHAGSSKKLEVHLTKPIVFGTTTLKAGDYYFQCKVIDGQHFLVALTLVDEKEVARTRCDSQELTAPVKETEFRTMRRGDDEVFTSVRYKGDTAAHMVAIQ